jgi:hypothetical protein
MIRTFVPLALVVAFGIAPDASLAQNCASGSHTFWKNDILPQNPSSLATISVIPGLCEGEAAGSVFTLAGGSGPQKVEKVAVGFGAAGGTGGFVALANIEVYDGITWAGNVPVLGTKVFDYEGQFSTSAQLVSTGINEVDLSGFNIVVGNGTTAFVVVFRMGFNPNGSCAGGYTANFFTDNSSIFGGCNTLEKKNVMFVQGQGWVDPKFATVSGFPLCPLFFNGNWAIRACTSPVAPAFCQQDLGLGGPGNTKLSICGGNLATGTSATFRLDFANPSVTAIVFVSPSFQPTFVPELFGFLCPLPALLAVPLPTDPLGQIVIPGVPGGGGPATVHMQAVSPDPGQVKGYEVSNCLRVNFLP